MRIATILALLVLFTSGCAVFAGKTVDSVGVSVAMGGNSSAPGVEGGDGTEVFSKIACYFANGYAAFLGRDAVCVELEE